VVQQPGIGFPLARIAVLLSLATGACHDLAVAPYAGKGTGETTLLRQMYDTLKPGDVVVADALFDNYFLVCELRQRGIDIVARAQCQRVGTRTVRSGPDGDLIVWQRPNKAHGMAGEQSATPPSASQFRQSAAYTSTAAGTAANPGFCSIRLHQRSDGGRESTPGSRPFAATPLGFPCEMPRTLGRKSYLIPAMGRPIGRGAVPAAAALSTAPP
jgi:hypothetical protein